MKNKWMKFNDAREFVRKLGLGGYRGWRNYCDSNLRPKNIPSNPDKTYFKIGWNGWIDWLNSFNKKYNKTYYINEYYFKKWSNNMAYILGLWFADGCISGTHFNITLHKNDVGLLKEISGEMKSDYRLYKNKGCIRMDFRSKKIVDSIKRLGGKPRKSLNVAFPYVPKKYLPHFIRGLWDGDGCIYFNKCENRYRSTFCSGSKKFIYPLHNSLKNNISGFKGYVYKRVYRRGHKIVNTKLSRDSVFYILECGSNDTVRLSRYLYPKDIEYIKMKRKFENFMGTGEICVAYRDRKYVCYKTAEKCVRNLNFKNRNEWFKYCRENGGNANIPFAPHLFYKREWNGWKNFLGYKHKFVSFEESKNIIRKIGIRGVVQWQKYRKNNAEKRIPLHPDKIYKNEGWKGWKDYLKT